jgi:hypothetical protein
MAPARTFRPHDDRFAGWRTRGAVHGPDELIPCRTSILVMNRSAMNIILT